MAASSPSLLIYKCKDHDRDVHLSLLASPLPQVLWTSPFITTSITTCWTTRISIDAHQTTKTLPEGPSCQTSTLANEISQLVTDQYLLIAPSPPPHNHDLDNNLNINPPRNPLHTGINNPNKQRTCNYHHQQKPHN